MMQLVRFIAELSRRRVLRLAGFYTVGAWLLLQIADVTFEPLNMPDWAMRYLVYLVVTGFFLTLVLGWRYDITHAGLVRAATTDADGNEIPPHPLRTQDFVTISGLAVAAFVIATALFMQSSGREIPELPLMQESSDARIVAIVPGNSVASDDGDEDLLAGLVTEVSQLYAPTKAATILVGQSAQQLAEQRAAACDVFETTGRCHLVAVAFTTPGESEGLTVSLIDARTGELEDLVTFAANPSDQVNTLCNRIADLLALESEAESEQICDTDYAAATPEALHHYLRGVGQASQDTADGIKAAIHSFAAAVEIEPVFAEAYARSGIAQLELVNYPGYPLSVVRKAARSAVFKAQELAPEARLTNAALGYWYERTGDYQAAAEAYASAVAGNAVSPTFLGKLYRIYDALDQTDEALLTARRLYRSDSLNLESNLEIGSLALRLGDMSLAGSTLTRAIAIDPNSAAAHSRLGDLYFAMGRCKDAEQEMILGQAPDAEVPVQFEPENLDFEDGTDYWTLGNESFDLAIDTDEVKSGSQSLRLGKPDAGERESGWVSQSIRPCELQGKRLRLSAYAKTSEIGNEFYFFMQARARPRHFETNRGRSLAADYMDDRRIKEDTDWTKYEIVLDVPIGTARLTYGVVLRGKGTAWFDDFELEMVDQSVPTTND